MLLTKSCVWNATNYEEMVRLKCYLIIYILFSEAGSCIIQSPDSVCRVLLSLRPVDYGLTWRTGVCQAATTIACDSYDNRKHIWLISPRRRQLSQQRCGVCVSSSNFRVQKCACPQVLARHRISTFRRPNPDAFMDTQVALIKIRTQEQNVQLTHQPGQWRIGLNIR